MKFRILLFTFFSITCILLSCLGEPKEAPLTIDKVLPGYWELINATRNGNPAPTLQGTYFEFDSLGVISTNLTGEQVVTEYTIEDNTILYDGAGKQNKLDFKINSIDTLTFNMVMRKIHKFELTMLKSEKKQ